MKLLVLFLIFFTHSYAYCGFWGIEPISEIDIDLTINELEEHLQSINRLRFGFKAKQAILTDPWEQSYKARTALETDFFKDHNMQLSITEVLKGLLYITEYLNNPEHRELILPFKHKIAAKALAKEPDISWAFSYLRIYYNVVSA
jgi:hypothetical protein